ncbi:lipid kinase, partial [Staphylococcus hyicus]
IGEVKRVMSDLCGSDGELSSFILNNDSNSIIKDIFSLRDSMTWNEISDNIKHIPSHHIHLSTTPRMRVDVDGEINFETPITIDIHSQKITLLTVPDTNQNN